MQNLGVHWISRLPFWLLLILLSEGTSLKCDERSTSCSSSLSDTLYCQVADIVFDVGGHTLRTYKEAASEEPLCRAAETWQLVSKRKGDANLLVCDQIFERGHFFTLRRGTSTPSLLRNTLLPLLHILYGPSTSEEADGTVLLPGIQGAEDGKIDWDAEEFLDSMRPENQMIQGLAGPHSVLPLDKRLSAVNKTICFRKASFGIPTTDASDPKLVSAFVSRLRGNLGLQTPKPHLGSKPRVGLALNFGGANKVISMPYWNRAVKEIVNFAQVVGINYNKLSLEEQISQMRGLNVLVVAADNTEALMGALYLPPWGVTVLLPGSTAKQDTKEVLHLLETSGRFLVHAPRPPPTTSANEVVRSDDEAATAIVQVVQKAVGLSQPPS